MHAENNKDLCVVCYVSSTRDPKEERRDERIVIMCTSFLFQADWHVDQRQYDAGDLIFDAR